MKAVIAKEQGLKCEPTDVSDIKGIGYDIESKPPENIDEGKLRFIEVKGRAQGATQITLTTNEVRCAINTPDQFILAIVIVNNAAVVNLSYIRSFPFREPGFGEASISYKLNDLMKFSTTPQMSTYRKKLIEVALPLDEINAACAREKSIRHGHPSTLHLWWARRPLAAARAVIFAQMVDDPSSIPGLSDEEIIAERERLFDIIRKLVLWENTTMKQCLKKLEKRFISPGLEHV